MLQKILFQDVSSKTHPHFVEFLKTEDVSVLMEVYNDGYKTGIEKNAEDFEMRVSELEKTFSEFALALEDFKKHMYINLDEVAINMQKIFFDTGFMAIEDSLEEIHKDLKNIKKEV
jgi:hypothetical protein